MDAARVGSESGCSGGSSDTREGEEPWIQQHPRFREMMSLDVADPGQAYAAFLVYMDLVEVRNWFDVQIVGSADLHLIYLHGREKEERAPQVIVPTEVSTSHSHDRIQQYMNLGCPSGDDQAAPPERNILLAIVESDSTIVYYKLTSGFVVPDPPDLEEFVGNKRKKKRMRLAR